MMSQSEREALESCRKRNDSLRSALAHLIDDCNDLKVDLQTAKPQTPRMDRMLTDVFFDTDPACQHYASADGPKLRKFHDPRTDTLLSDYSDIASYRDLVEEFGEPGEAP